MCWGQNAQQVAHLNQIQYPQLAFCAVDNEHKVKCRVTPVNDPPSFVLLILWSKKGFQFWGIEEIA